MRFHTAARKSKVELSKLQTEQGVQLTKIPRYLPSVNHSFTHRYNTPRMVCGNLPAVHSSICLITSSINNNQKQLTQHSDEEKGRKNNTNIDAAMLGVIRKTRLRKQEEMEITLR
jgi:hypothetical protein